MANPKRPEHDIKLCGKTYTIPLTYQLIVSLENALGYKLSMMASRLEHFSYEEVAQVLHAILEAHGEKDAPSVDEIGAYVFDNIGLLSSDNNKGALVMLQEFLESALIRNTISQKK